MAVRAGKVFLEEERRREVGRARNIVEWLEMALIAIAANAEHLPFMFAWTCSKKARREYSQWRDEETSVASSGASDTGIVYNNASNTSTNKRREPMSKHFRLFLFTRSRHPLTHSPTHQTRAGYALDGIKVALRWQISTAATATIIVRSHVEELE
jgi:hypothetical protein